MRFLASLFVVALFAVQLSVAADRPNILWITSEDNGPYLGCYGDAMARSPHIDSLAKRGTRYVNCFSNAAVCAPARQTLISGMYATSIGGQHMRSKVVYPDGVSYFPKYLRDAGYYTSNNSKTDYNGGPRNGNAAMKEAWDESGKNAHWRNRPKGKSFFSVFNFTDSHESNLFPARWKKRKLITDPAKVKLPAYLPDVPEIRLDKARYYDCIETMDAKVGRILGQLEDDGLADNTIVFYYGDHGGSLPRGKSFTYDSGTRVPLIVHVPDKWKQFRPSAAGSASDRMVSFVDFSSTVLSLAGVDVPKYMQGRPFLGKHAAEARTYVHTFRGRRGERYDIVRGVRDQQFLYLRNYTSHLPVMQYNAYSFGIPGYNAWMKAWQDGKCNPAQAQWFKPKAAEELYRIADDPDNIRNLASDPKFATELKRLRAESERHIREIRDSVFFAEELTGRQYSAYQDDKQYPLDRLLKLGAAVSERSETSLPRFVAAMKDENACVRYWGATGCVALGAKAKAATDELVARLADSEPVIQLQAARALVVLGQSEQAIPIIKKHALEGREFVALQAVLIIDECDLLKQDATLRAMLKKVKGAYPARVIDKMLDAK